MASRPNILLIMTDQHNSEVAGFAGDKHVNTQHLDQIAAKSVQFNNAVCTSPVCTPSRMSMLTGKDVHNCGAWNNHWIIFPEHKTWPEHFAQHGYRTCLVGKMHFGGRDQMQGFQFRPYGDLHHGLGHQPEPLELFPGYAACQSAGASVIPESMISDVVITRETLSFLLEHQDTEPDKPWFMVAGYTRPHSPFTAPGRYIRRYRDKVPSPKEALYYRDGLSPYARDTFDGTHNEKLTEEITRRGVEAYYACVDYVDDCIGELLGSLENAGMLENTIVIYVSDHGEMIGQHGLWGKAVYYDPAIMIPLLMSGPGIKTGHREVDCPLSIMDLFPTCCSLAGLPIPQGLDGLDFSGILADPDNSDDPRDFTVSAYYKYGVRVQHFANTGQNYAPNRAMRVNRQRNWKYVDIDGGKPLLFNLADDPGENTNLADDPVYADRCRDMQSQLNADGSWDSLRERLERDRARLADYASGVKPTMPNQYMLRNGQVFDAETELYNSRWLYIPPESTGGIIPQMNG